ncbi:MAG: aminotransferase class I/II-fold pyridoxal phosphate-dependent enzyme [Actinobacteria bacterium]|jgi:succinyldiaminopimelate transaminase|nr:aminotransferase class I/II-fold pyridoxal phosphate-dependent enzyme [Actinomycetota bacterium]MBT4037770.1 aminotransferase class I/II-fold pyridoxal phosphate-dependent enzyme [Actinomycetota bacterium]MBT4278387.1 aminotransferase class I/II-fold pyridoxal phosphate-dependent enzyme [Actinomycetota bacterium]MBT4343121.1 aminotransferase class I/II-fold pyridoxal phosphate-dependent enzyme [Actinomycetota bacterium]MBT4785709.1 aminotransferase class I/II-fold pyridoxal phosphate-depende
MAAGFQPPPYPFDRIDDLRQVAASLPGGSVDLSIGNPSDPVPEVVAAALAEPDPARTYPPSIGSADLRRAVADWADRSLGVSLEPAAIGACIGTKELVTGLPHLLRLRDPARDTILYPAVSYPSYAMGAELAGCRAVAVPLDAKWCLDLSAIEESDAARALALWVNTPGNPAGGLDDLEAAASWGRSHGVTVLSDECYAEFTWQGPPRSVLRHGSDGVLAVHSLSKRSNLAGLRVGYYAGDPYLVTYLQEVRKHQGFMVPGPAQAAAVAALSDQTHVDIQRDRYRRRLESLVEVMAAVGVDVPMPGGGFYLWAPAPGGDAWGFARRLADEVGMVASPGEFFGEAGSDHVRLAAVAGDERIELLRDRVGI